MASASSYSNLVQELYVAYFGRPADYFGLQNFEAALAAANAPTDPAALATAYSTNSAVKSLVDSFGTSAESTTLYGSGSTESFVNAIFENLFNRPAAVAGLTFWVNAIESGAVSKGDAALAILAGAESNTTTQGVSDWTLIQNKIAVATNFTTALGNSSTQIVDYAGSAAAQDARLMLAGVTASTDPTTFNVQTTINDIVANNHTNTYNLTTGVDTLVGGTGNNFFNAILDNAAGVSAGGQAATLQSFDSITGGTLNNTLNITDFGQSGQMTIPSGAAITGITTVNVNSLEGIGTNGSTPLDFSTLGNNLTNVNINSSSGYDFVKVGDETTLVITDTATSFGYVDAFGGSTVTVNNNASSPTATGNYVDIYGGASTTAVTINHGYNSENYIFDANHSNGKTNTIATVTLNSQIGYSNYIYSTALTQLNLIDVTNAAVYESVATTATRTLNVTMDGLNSASGFTGDQAYLSSYATTVNITASGTASDNLELGTPNATALSFDDSANLGFYQGTVAGSGYLAAPLAKSVTIAGAGNFTADLSGLNAAAVINASGSSGVITVEMGSAYGKVTEPGQSFTGGTGQDIVTVGASQTGTITAGSAANNEIILANAPAATQADLATYSHFSILGVTGSTTGTFDMSKLTNGSSYKSFDIHNDTATAAPANNITFTNAATGSSLSIEGNFANVATLQTSDTTGQADSVNVSLGTTSTTHATVAQVTLEDSINVGTGTVNLASNVASSGSTNTLTSLFDNNWITLNTSGTGSLDIVGNKVDSSSLTINNSLAATATESLTIGTLTDNLLTTLTFKGADGIYISTLNSTTNALTLVDNDAQHVYINDLVDTALTSATFTNSVNTTAGTFTISNGLVENGLTTLNLNGNVIVGIVGDTVSSGITVAGGTDNASVLFVSTGATASGKTDSITLGNGTDQVSLGAGVAGSTQTVVLGSGVGDTVTTTSAGAVNVTVGSATSGTDSITADSATTLHVTAGNGTNVIADTAIGASVTVSAGTGANSITLGGPNGAVAVSGTISFGTHAATVVDTISLGASGSTTTSVSGLEKISGLNNVGADSLVFSGETAAVASIRQITSAEVAATAGGTGDATLLSAWIAAATGAAGSGVTTAAHSISWFQYQGNTYLVEMTGADTGTLATTDTVVELTGTGYTFAKTTFTGGNGHVNLLG